MTHFLAIAIFRRDEYKAAGLPVFPVRFSVFLTKILMMVYAWVFAFALFVLYLIADLGLIYAIPLGLLSVGWIVLSLQGLRTKDDTKWAKQMFFSSILILLTFCIVLALS